MKQSPFPLTDSDWAAAQQQATLYRHICREPESPVRLDARILAMARLQAESNARMAQRRLRSRLLWRFIMPLLATTACLVVAWTCSTFLANTKEKTSALQPASLTAPQTPAQPLPEIRMPVQAPASTQANDPCRIRVTPDSASPETLSEERERLATQGCQASLAQLEESTRETER